MAYFNDPGNDEQIVLDNFDETTELEDLDQFITCPNCKKDYEILLEVCPFCHHDPFDNE